MRPIEVSISLPGFERRLTLPAITPGGSIDSATQMLGYWQSLNMAPFNVLARADRLLAKLAASS